MSDTDKKTFLFVALAIAVIVVLMRYMKPGATGPVYLGQAPANTSAPTNTGYNPYLPPGNAAGPSSGGTQPNDTSQWLQFGASLAGTLGKLGGNLIQTY